MIKANYFKKLAGEKPIALDLFCGAGGVTKGLQQAGFFVIGVDIKKQPRYCGDHFIVGDATEAPMELLKAADFIWASPPCQAHTALKSMPNAKEHHDLIPPTREMLRKSSKPFAMENVPGAPLNTTLVLCGTMFDLGTGDAELRRHRLFEINFTVGLTPPLPTLSARQSLRRLWRSWPRSAQNKTGHRWRLRQSGRQIEPRRYPAILHAREPRSDGHRLDVRRRIKPSHPASLQPLYWRMGDQAYRA